MGLAGVDHAGDEVVVDGGLRWQRRPSGPTQITPGLALSPKCGQGPARWTCAGTTEAGAQSTGCDTLRSARMPRGASRSSRWGPGVAGGRAMWPACPTRERRASAWVLRPPLARMTPPAREDGGAVCRGRRPSPRHRGSPGAARGAGADFRPGAVHRLHKGGNDGAAVGEMRAARPACQPVTEVRKRPGDHHGRGPRAAGNVLEMPQIRARRWTCRRTGPSCQAAGAAGRTGRAAWSRADRGRGFSARRPSDAPGASGT